MCLVSVSFDAETAGGNMSICRLLSLFLILLPLTVKAEAAEGTVCPGPNEVHSIERYWSEPANRSLGEDHQLDPYTIGPNFPGDLSQSSVLDYWYFHFRNMYSTSLATSKARDVGRSVERLNWWLTRASESLNKQVSFNRLDQPFPRFGNLKVDLVTQWRCFPRLAELLEPLFVDYAANDEQLRESRQQQTQKNAERLNAEQRQQAEARRQQEQAAAEKAKRDTAIAATRGPSYVEEAKTVWTIRRSKNAITAQEEIKITSIQKNGTGAVAEITGECSKNAVTSGVVFKAVIVDDGGRPRLGFPDQTTDPPGVYANYRINDSDAGRRLLGRSSFDNQLAITVLIRQETLNAISSEARTDPLAQITQFTAALSGVHFLPAESTWRVLSQINTTAGELLIKIPVFNEHIQTLIHACLPPPREKSVPAEPSEPIAPSESDVLVPPKRIPNFVYMPEEAYPATSKRVREEGTVTLLLTIDERGYVIESAVHESSGFERLDEAAVKEAFRLPWRFIPGTRNGRPEAMQLRIGVPFSLNE
jgi:TonB family protein